MSAGGVPPLVRLRPELLDDVSEAFEWYEAQAKGSGHDFTRAFFAAVARASRQSSIARLSCTLVSDACVCVAFRTRSITGQ